MKFYSLLSTFALITLLMIAMGQLTIFAQADEKTSGNIEKSDLVAKTTVSGAAKTNAGSFPRFPRKAPTASHVWHGFYAGAYAGASLGRATANTSTVTGGYFALTSPPAIATSGRQDLRPTRFTGGGTFGYNHQSGNLVVGAETDLGFLSGTSSATTTTTYPCCSPSTFTVTQSIKSRWLWTARPRVGYARGNALFYITGGLAVTHLNYQALFTDTFGARESGGIDKTRTGWSGGGGAEFKISGNWSFKGEYLYSDFGRQTVTSTNLTSPPSNTWPQNPFTHSIFLAQHDLRFGINYHF